MKNETVEPTRKRRVSYLVLFVIGVSIFIYLVDSRIFFPLQSLFYLVAGWILFLRRVIPQVTVPVSGLVTALVVAAIMALLIQLLGGIILRRLQQQNSIPVPNKWKIRWTFALIVFLVISFTGGFAVVGLTHQGLWLAASEKIVDYNISAISKRSQSKNNLKQIGLALYNYQEATQVLPGGGYFNSAGKPQHGWVAQLLPYLDQQALYQTIDFHEPWTADINREPYQTALPLLINPGLRRQDHPTGYQPVDYAANNHIFNVNTSMKLDMMKEGASNTILAGEVNTGIKAWGDPTNFRDPNLGINASPQGFGSPYFGGAHFLLGDGSVRFISENIDPRTLKALATPDGNEPVGEY
ncbi:DUF1559 family PulG-like putative transporter [Gimesia algae]|uniref:DUF1559 domain-containing protein n=1 Tax=Gimesia algae TaxID=2527971 RepID=A0A517V668_9PLAN|nr:DUF1559 domain-containing protein [Gimesia algae]QDT88499.1 hypothetical protein Pan161_01150 [Gimesia algae]